MAINPHDDYEALAKLLYPSIEASGNVYYGQTRKLTMDEILGKNDLGFESHIESVKVADSSADYGFNYIKKYCWKLGPFHGVIDYRTDDEFLVCYEKYKINIDSSVNINVLHSGDYKTYEKNVTLYDAGYYSSNGSAPNSSEYWDGRNFYVVEENNCHYLFIAIPQDMTHNDDYLELKAVGGPVDITLNKTGDFDWYAVECWGGRTYRYLYKKNTDSDYSDYEGNTITLQNGESVFFKAASNRPAFSQQSYVSFSMTSTSSTASVEAFGNLSAMSRGDDNEDWSYEFYKLFESCTLLTRAPYIPKPPSDCEHTFHDIFHNCTSLKRVQPTLPMPDYPGDGCYQSAFKGCTSLEVAPYLPSDDGYDDCYSEMFYGCRLLKEVKARIIANNAHDDYTRNWLKDAGLDATDKKLIYLSKESGDSRFLIGDDSFVPNGWEIRDLSGKRATCMAIVKTSGNDVYLSSLDLIAVSDTGISFRTFYDSGFEVSGEYVICLMSDPIDGANANGISIGHIQFNNNPEYPRVTSITNTTVTDGAIDKPVINELITNGCDSSENGRGSITTKSTIGNMAKENPFLKGGRYGYDSRYSAPIKPDTYNSDGSYNQEIWGYKCFNSPVSFRNGIYGENVSLIAFSDDNFSGSTLYQKDGGLSQYSNNDDVLSQLMTYKRSDASDFSSIGDLTITNGHSDGAQMITSIHNDDSDVEYNFDSFVKSSIASGTDSMNDAWTESDTSIGSTMRICTDNLTIDRGTGINSCTWFGFSGTLIKSSLKQTDPDTELTNTNNVAGALVTDESVKLTASKYEQVHPDDDDDEDFGDDDDNSNESEPIPESENSINGKYTSRSEVEICPDHVTVGFDDIRNNKVAGIQFESEFRAPYVDYSGREPVQVPASSDIAIYPENFDYSYIGTANSPFTDMYCQNIRSAKIHSGKLVNPTIANDLNDTLLQVNNYRLLELYNPVIRGEISWAPSPKSLYDCKSDGLAYLQDIWHDFNFTITAGSPLRYSEDCQVIYFTMSYGRTSSSHNIHMVQLIVKQQSYYIYMYYFMNEGTRYSAIPVSDISNGQKLIPSGYKNINRRAVFCVDSLGSMVKIFKFNQSSTPTVITNLSQVALNINGTDYSFDKIRMFNCCDNRLIVSYTGSSSSENDKLWICDNKVTIEGDFTSYTLTGTEIEVDSSKITISTPYRILDVTLVSNDKMFVTYYYYDSPPDEYYYQSVEVAYNEVDGWHATKGHREILANDNLYNTKFEPPEYNNIQKYVVVKTYMLDGNAYYRVYIPGGLYYVHPSPRMSLLNNEYQFVGFISQVCEMSEYGCKHLL